MKQWKENPDAFDLDFVPLTLSCAFPRFPHYFCCCFLGKRCLQLSLSLRQSLRRYCRIAACCLLAFVVRSTKSHRGVLIALFFRGAVDIESTQIEHARRLVGCDEMRSICGEIWPDFQAEEKNDEAEVLTLWAWRLSIKLRVDQTGKVFWEIR
jgi:hypothetical protein